MPNRTLALLMLLVYPLMALPNGGTIVGNGMLLDGMTGYQALGVLHQAAPSCLINGLCQLTADQMNTLKKIDGAILNPNLNFPEDLSTPRYSSTREGLSLNLSEILSKFSDLTGRTDQVLKSGLDAKLQAFVMARLSMLQASSKQNPSLKVSILVFNSDFPIKRANVSLRLNQDEPQDISDKMIKSSGCKDALRRSLGTEFVEGRIEETNSALILKGVLRHYCTTLNRNEVIVIDGTDVSIPLD